MGPANEYFGAIIIDERAACQADPVDLVYSKRAPKPLDSHAATQSR
jgi:hypothetical protein